MPFEPGFQFEVKMYHSGTSHGALGIKTHGLLNPTLSLALMKGLHVGISNLLLVTHRGWSHPTSQGFT